MSAVRFAHGDCLDVFGAEPDESFDSFVSDPPAGIGFMGRTWDRDRGGRDRWVAAWAERFEMARRKAKPGAYSLTWALPRTSHWTATAIEDAGWTVQDVIAHHFGQGWPKGTSALKPASEHWILARNGGGGALQIDACRVPRGSNEPNARADKGSGVGYGGGNEERGAWDGAAGSYPTNLVLSHHELCEERGSRSITVRRGGRPKDGPSGMWSVNGGRDVQAYNAPRGGTAYMGEETIPAFHCLAGCDCGATTLAPSGGAAPRCACGAAMWWCCPVAQMDAQSKANGMHSAGSASAGIRRGPQRGNVYAAHPGASSRHGDTDNGSAASRFFPRFTYQAKAPSRERHAGCEHLLWRADRDNAFGFSRVDRATWEALAEAERAQGNVHPTVKSLALMQWLVSLVTPPGGRVGDLTAGSGGTGIAVARMNAVAAEPMAFLGADICAEAVEIAEARLAWWRGVRGEKPKAAPRPATPEVDPRQRTLFDLMGATP